MQSVRWLGASRRDAITQALAPITRAWLGAWWLRPPAQPCWRSDAAWMPAFARTRWLHAASEAGRLALLAHGDVTALGYALADVHDGTETALAERLGLAALRDLAWRVLGANDEPTAGPPLEAGALPPALALAARGGGRFALDLGGRPLMVLAVDATLAARLAPPAVPPPATLMHRMQVIGNGRARMQLRLDLGEMPLGQLRQLAVGEVIASRIPLDTPFALGLPHAPSLAHARLGRVGTSRAAVLIASNRPSQSPTS